MPGEGVETQPASQTVVSVACAATPLRQWEHLYGDPAAPLPVPRRSPGLAEVRLSAPRATRSGWSPATTDHR